MSAETIGGKTSTIDHEVRAKNIEARREHYQYTIKQLEGFKALVRDNPVVHNEAETKQSA